MKKSDEKIDFRYNLKVYYNLLVRHKWVFIFLSIAVLIIESSLLALNYLFKLVTDNGASFVSGDLSRDAFVKILLGVLAVYIGIMMIKSIFQWVKHHFLNSLDSHLMADIKRKFFNHLIGLHYGFHTSHKTGSLIAKLLRGSSSIERFTDIIVFNFLPLIFGFIMTFLVILYFDLTSAIVVLVIVVAFILYGLFLLELQKESNIGYNENEDYEKGVVSDVFTNVESIKYFGKEFSIKEKYKKISERTRLSLMKYWGYFRWLDSGHEIILGIGILLLIYFPITKFLNNELTIGTLVFIYGTFGNLVSILFRFVYGIRGFYRSMADFHSLFKYDKIHNEIEDMENSRELKITKGEIEFRNVTFGYRKSKILKNFNLKIPRGKKVAFVGHSGSGKTTLVRLLYRLYDLDSGGILIDGKNIKEFKQESLRSELSIVPQECVLFDETIYNNIAFSNPGSKKEDVINAIKSAQLYDIMKTFPNKEKTIVGERGVKLSGGEKQRVSIARAILAGKKILVLDEPTSSLDSKTESEIQKSLEILMKNRTTIIIAHRLSTIMNSDIIIVMNKGKIVQKGDHKQLINKEGLYRELWDLQKGGYIR